MILALVEAVKNLKNAVVQIYNLLFVKTTVAIIFSLLWGEKAVV